MLCAVIKGPTYSKAHEQLAYACLYAKVAELRLDYFAHIDLPAIQTLMKSSLLPLIFTLRSRCQGGEYPGIEAERLADIRRLATLKPTYLDLESHVPETFIDELLRDYPATQLILSHHDFCKTPADLAPFYVKKHPHTLVKWAFKARSTNDALRLLSFAKDKPQLIAISLGSYGRISRILGPLMGSPLTYASLEDDPQSVQLGQLTVQSLPRPQKNTRLYGLIGDPVDQSISDQTHNHLLSLCGLNAFYVKIPLKVHELSEFLSLAKQIPFRGLSVTMPLKEAIVPYLDHLDPTAKAIGAVNTVCFEESTLIGYNTDGIGALDSIEKKMQVKGKRLIIIGAGGAARAIAYEAYQRGALVTILNRDAAKAQKLAHSFGCQGYGIDQMAACFKRGYDILINCTPSEVPIDPLFLHPHALIMDISYIPKERALLEKAQVKGSFVIYGYQMFAAQAKEQFALWEQLDPERCGAILEQKALACLV